MTRGRCYAGTNNPERPTAFEWEDGWLAVAEVLRSARMPEGIVFDVLAENGKRYSLQWTEASDNWNARGDPKGGTASAARYQRSAV